MFSNKAAYSIWSSQIISHCCHHTVYLQNSTYVFKFLNKKKRVVLGRSKEWKQKNFSIIWKVPKDPFGNNFPPWQNLWKISRATRECQNGQRATVNQELPLTSWLGDKIEQWNDLIEDSFHLLWFPVITYSTIKQ